MAAARAWRESRRCGALVADPRHPSGTRVCGALAYRPCRHRPGGEHDQDAPRAAVGRFPYPHRTVAEVDRDEFIAMQAAVMVHGNAEFLREIEKRVRDIEKRGGER